MNTIKASFKCGGLDCDYLKPNIERGCNFKAGDLCISQIAKVNYMVLELKRQGIM